MNSIKHKFVLTGIILIFYFHGSNTLCQDNDRIKTVFTNDARFGFLWSPGFKLNSVFNELTSEVDLYGGLLINEKILLGASGGTNIGSPRINYEYVGLICQYIYKPGNFIHYSWHTTLCYGSLRVKDFGNSVFEKNDFYFMEPGFNIEINLGRRLRLITGISYRFVPSRNDRSTSGSFFTKRDLGGMDLRIGLVTGNLLEVLK